MNQQDDEDRNAASVDIVYRAIGELSCAFSNNESILTVLMEKLLRTDRAGAILVFGTLNTTRARIDLLRRLARARLATEPEILKETEGLLLALEKATRFRNDILHAMYVYDVSEERIIETQAMRIDERRGVVSYGNSRPMDQQRIDAIGREIRKMNNWNKSMWTHIAEIALCMAPGASMGGSEPTGAIGEMYNLRP